MSNILPMLDSSIQFIEFGWIAKRLQPTNEINTEIRKAVTPAFAAIKDISLEITTQASLYLLEAEKVVQQIVDTLDPTMQACVKLFEDVIAGINSLLTSIKETVEREGFDAVASVIAICVLPSLIDFADHEVDSQMREAARKIEAHNALNESKIEPITLNIFEGVRLSHKPDVNPNRATVVYFLANRELWQSRLENLSDLHKQTSTNVVCYNYRGTAKTVGFPTTENTLVKDGIAQVQHLIDQGIAANNIKLYGYSLFGSAIATGVASAFSEKDIILDVCLDRPSQNLHSVIVKTGSFYPEQCADLVTKFGWTLDSEANIAKMKGKLIVVYNPKEPETALTPAEDKTSDDRIEYIEMNDEEFEKENQSAAAEIAFDPHTRPFSKSESGLLYEKIKELLK